MNAYILGLAMAPASKRHDRQRLEELVYDTSSAALRDASLTQGQLDHVTLGACDEIDGRPISSMLMTVPAGGYDTDEIKVTDSGATALCLEYARILSGDFQLGLVVSWCKSSKTDIEQVMRFRGDPFFTRPLGIGSLECDALFAQAVAQAHRITEQEVCERVVAASARAAKNTRGIGREPVSLQQVANAPYDATPLRTLQRAPPSDGAVSMVVASEQFVQANPQCKPLARLCSVGWANDSYRLDRRRLSSMASARTAWNSALMRASLRSARDFDVIEIESPTGYHEAAFTRAFEIEDPDVVSPSGGAFAQNPVFCTGLVNAAEAVLQVAGRAGAVQRTGARRAAAHSCHGFAQQGNVVMTFESVGAGA